MAMEAMTKMIATTINSSMSEKPFCLSAMIVISAVVQLLETSSAVMVPKQ
jgi:hypothetical protein